MKFKLLHLFEPSVFLSLQPEWGYPQVAALPAVEQVLQEWDIKQTDVLLEKLEADRSARQEQERKLRDAENSRFVAEVFFLLPAVFFQNSF